MEDPRHAQGPAKNVLGIGQRPRPLPRATQQLGAVGFEPVSPGAGFMGRLHAMLAGCLPEERHGADFSSMLVTTQLTKSNEHEGTDGTHFTEGSEKYEFCYEL